MREHDVGKQLSFCALEIVVRSLESAPDYNSRSEEEQVRRDAFSETYFSKFESRAVGRASKANVSLVDVPSCQNLVDNVGTRRMSTATQNSNFHP